MLRRNGLFERTVGAKGTVPASPTTRERTVLLALSLRSRSSAYIVVHERGIQTVPTDEYEMVIEEPAQDDRWWWSQRRRRPATNQNQGCSYMYGCSNIVTTKRLIFFSVPRAASIPLFGDKTPAGFIICVLICC